MPFHGFPDGVRLTPVPDPFFNALLVEIKDVVELKVTLRAFWLLAQQRGPQRSLAEGELLTDPTLLQGLQTLDGSPPEQAQAGLAKAVARKTLLRCPAAAGSSDRPRYLLNTAANRRHLARQGDGTAPGAKDEPPLPPGDLDIPAAPAATARTNIYALYEDNIGLIGPQLAQYLQEAEDRYPERWIADAFAIAIRENKRSWSYIAAILRRWAGQGRGGLKESTAAAQQQSGIGIKAGAVLWETKEVDDGEPGRYTPANSRPQ